MSFKIIKHAGTPKEAKLPDGTRVFRKPSIRVEWKTADALALNEQIPVSDVLCAPYDDHFVFETPLHLKEAPSYMCTCGSAAIIVIKLLGEHPELGKLLGEVQDDMVKNPQRAFQTLLVHPELVTLANAIPSYKSENLFVCMMHMQYGHHVTSYANIKDWGSKKNIVIPEEHYRDRSRAE